VNSHLSTLLPRSAKQTRLVEEEQFHSSAHFTTLAIFLFLFSLLHHLLQ
jgi:hypothetical protein